MTDPKTVRISDIARVAGVASSTVSKALNGSDEVSEPTRRRVTEVATRLGYRPNAIARSLKTRRTHTLGVITSDSDGLFTTAMVRGVAEVASEHQFGVFLCNSYGDLAVERQHIELLLDKQVDGIIMTGDKVEERGSPAASTGQLPLVYLYSHTNATPSPCILPDDRAGARLATQHLLDQGRRHVAFINGPGSFAATHLRLAGYRDGLASRGGEFEAGLVRSAPDWNQGSGFTYARELVSQTNPPDAIFCANDDLAAGAILGLWDLGLNVPRDVAIVGFDDRPFAAHLPVALTTVALPLHTMGARAARKLFDLVNGEPTQSTLVHVPCDLVIRDSCGSVDGAHTESIRRAASVRS